MAAAALLMLTAAVSAQTNETVDVIIVGAGWAGLAGVS